MPAEPAVPAEHAVPAMPAVPAVPAVPAEHAEHAAPYLVRPATPLDLLQAVYQLLMWPLPKYMF